MTAFRLFLVKPREYGEGHSRCDAYALGFSKDKQDAMSALQLSLFDQAKHNHAIGL